MDPLSLVARVIGVSNIAVRTTSSLYQLINVWHDAPQDVHHLGDQISSTGDFFRMIGKELNISTVGNANISADASFGSYADLSTLVEAATSIVTEIGQIIQEINSPSKSTEYIDLGELDHRVAGRTRRSRWIVKRKKVLKLQSMLLDTKRLILERLILIST